MCGLMAWIKPTKSYYKGTISNIIKITKCLKDEYKNGKSFLTFSQISKRTGLHKGTVTRIVKLYMSGFVNIEKVKELEEIGLTINLVSLKDNNISYDKIAKMIETKKLVRGSFDNDNEEDI